jgi:hypothetical protein
LGEGAVALAQGRREAAAARKRGEGEKEGLSAIFLLIATVTCPLEFIVLRDLAPKQS